MIEWGKWTGASRRTQTQADSCVCVFHPRTQTILADRVLIADRGTTRRVGLLGRASLDRGEGLWIVPCEAVHTIGMRFSIDLIFLDRKRRICKICHAVPPWRLSGALRAHSVIELGAGTLAGVDLVIGDPLVIQ